MSSDRAPTRSARSDFITQLFLARNWWRLRLDKLFKPYGLTDATWRVLFLLRRIDGALQKEIAMELGIEGPSLVRHLDNLEAKGLIERRTAPNDRRAKSVHLTSTAQPLLRELAQVGAADRDEVLDRFTPEELATCVSVLRRMAAGEF